MATEAVKNWGDSAVRSIGQLGLQQKSQLEMFAAQLATLTDSNEQRMNELRSTVDEPAQTDAGATTRCRLGADAPDRRRDASPPLSSSGWASRSGR